jgi:MCP family monocarboxylic acid transporter-like MFS transporter 13/MCP family monocarboxylic acid transporter-like MFS transporter 12
MYITASIVIHYHFERWRALANGIAVTGSGVGTLILALLTQWLINKLQWRLALVVEGSIMLLGIACAATYRPVQTAAANDESERRPLLRQTSSPGGTFQSKRHGIH